MVSTLSPFIIIASFDTHPLTADGEADVALWNKEIAKYFQGTT